MAAIEEPRNIEEPPGVGLSAAVVTEDAAQLLEAGRAVAWCTWLRSSWTALGVDSKQESSEQSERRRNTGRDAAAVQSKL